VEAIRIDGDFHEGDWRCERKVDRRRNSSAMVFGGGSQVRLDQQSMKEARGSH